ncbi:hypothetical protein [Humidisolicoccus flavus]|uniref:hypothetical protein n=1 Tax=Humidisolicoccus flavus TaxID=3111414 RepID=UPI00324BABBB
MTMMDTQELKIVAILHDAIEKGSLEWEELGAAGFSPEIIAAIDALTDRDGETPEESLERVRHNRLAIRVKLADLYDNADPERLQVLSEKKQSQLRAKYERKATALGTTIAAIRSESIDCDALVDSVLAESAAR